MKQNHTGAFGYFAVLFFCLLVASSCDPSKRTVLPPVLGNGADSTLTNKDTNIIDTLNVVSVDTQVIIPEVVSWCDTIPKGTYTLLVVCYEKKNGRITADTIKELSTDPRALFDPNNVDTPTTLNLKPLYRVAVMMPFLSNKFNPSTKAEIPGQALRAIEFYEGVKIALDSLRDEGVNLSVDVFDTKKSPEKVREILEKEELLNADLIIGPVSSKLLPMVSEFAKVNNKLLVSPFNPRGSLANDNPNYIQVNPSYRVHSEQIAKFIAEYKPREGKRVLMMGMQQDTGRMNMIQEDYAIVMNDETVTIPQYTSSGSSVSIGNIKGQLSSSAVNVVIIPSYKREEFIYSALRELQSLINTVEIRRSYKIIVVGMPQWKYYERVNFEYYENLHLHITSEFFADSEEQDIRDFRRGYARAYGMPPREYGFIGFDVMVYFGRLLQKYGNDFPYFFHKEQHQGKHTRFSFEPVYKVEGVLDGVGGTQYNKMLSRYENKHINMLQFSEYSFRKVEAFEYVIPRN